MGKNHTSRNSKNMRSVKHVKGVTVFSFPDSVWKTSTWRTRKRGTKGQRGKRFPVRSGTSRRVGEKQKFRIKAVKPKVVKVAEPEKVKIEQKIVKPEEKPKPKQAEKKPQKEKEKTRTIRLSDETKTMPSRDDIEAEAYRMYMMDNPQFDTTPERHELSEEGYLRAAQRNLMSTGKENQMTDDYIKYLKRDLEERGYTIVPMR